VKGWLMSGLALALLAACAVEERGMGLTQEEDFTLTLEVVDRSVHVGDQTPLVVRFWRTDHSNLPKGMRGAIVITTTAHGQVNPNRIEIEVADHLTREISQTLIFTAERPGVAEIRASFLEASARVKVLISGIVI
jgi:hypothetical protein